MPNSSKAEISAFIIQKARELGFEEPGFAKANILMEERDNFNEWLSANYNGEMAWMEREPEKRSDPRLIFPDAKSVVVVLQNYYTPYEHSSGAETGKISRYAFGDDYHVVLKDKLYKLLEGIKTLSPDIEGKVCVDTAPIMEKPWAVHSGLGWIGKNSNLLTKQLGSWVFIGILLLNVELNYAETSQQEHCGSCTLCIDACPTEAIVEPYLVDSNRCISYATIELRTPTLSPDIARNLEGWLYGCDICQDVCPWNRFSQPTFEKRFQPRDDNISPKLKQIASLTREEYVEKYRGSAIKRTKLEGLKRNARALLENSTLRNEIQ
ncbi:MAG: tRNA epoxyqueuosine(34) reductase QueG [Pyrinomonadaceae bacterium]